MQNQNQNQNQNQSSLESLRLMEARKILDHFTMSLDGINVGTNFSKAIDIILNCKGRIICSGVGKAGIAMKKFSALLCSFGFSSYFLDPLNAQHGDLGVLQENDVLFLCSTSGKTREVYELIDLARNINVKTIIGLTSHPDSPLRKKVDLVIDMGIIVEAGHLGLAPTTSILVILAITDALALICAKEKGITKKQYGKFHHSGYLGLIARGEKDSETY